MTGGTLCFRIVRLSFLPSSRRPSRFRGSSTTLRAAPSKIDAFSTHYYTYIAMPTWPRCAPLILCWPWLPYNLFPRSCLTWIFLCRSSLMGTTLRAAPSKSYTFSTNYHACIALPTWHRCAPTILFWPWPPHNLLPRSCLTWIFSVDFYWWVQLCLQRPAKAMPFQQIIMHALQCQHDLDVHLLFCFDLDLHNYNLFPRSCLTWIFSVNFYWWVQVSSILTDTCRYHFACSTQQKPCLSTNYHTCIAMPTWRRCAPPIMFWPWPPYNLLPRSCFTWIFFVNPHWWVPLCVQCPAKAMPFKQIIMHALQC